MFNRLTQRTYYDYVQSIISYKAKWIGHILRRNCILQRVIEGKIKGGIEVTGRRGRRRRKLLDDLKERREYSHLKEKALDRPMRRARFGRGFGPVVRETTKLMNESATCFGYVKPSSGLTILHLQLHFPVLYACVQN